MKMLIVGATGRLGRLLVTQALDAGHEVTAFVRNPAAFTTQHANLRVVQGDVLVSATIDSVVAGHDAVLAGLTPPARQKTILFSQGVQNLITSMDTHGVRRLLWVTSAAVDPVDAAATPWLFRKVIVPLAGLGPIYEDAALSETVLQASGLDWVVIRPTRLTDGPRTGVYRVGLPHVPSGGRAIARADVADFMLKQIIDAQYVHKATALAY